MKHILIYIFLFLLSCNSRGQGTNEDERFATSKDLQITNATVNYDAALDQLIFSIEVVGRAGATKPSIFGQMNGAPVLGYVFPTTLLPTDVGFSATEGIVALAITSHPDFDDTPLWDENNDRNYANDGVIWHPHWVVLQEDLRVTGGLSVKQFESTDKRVTLPPTNPGMPMFMDSPGFPVRTNGRTNRTVVPAYRMNNKTRFNFDAVTAYMQVNGTDPDLPMLGVYTVYSVASGDLSLPYGVKK